MIVAQIATIPSRSKTVLTAAYSLMFQVDHVNLILNGPWRKRDITELKNRIPRHTNINVILPDGYEKGSDGWKFYGLKKYSPETYFVIADDDIEYPEDFVATMKEMHKGNEVLTVMGKILKPRPIRSFYRDELKCFKTFEENEKIERVEIPGTCGMLLQRYCCDDLDHTFFKSVNSDVWMGVYCKQKNLPAFVVPHSANWLKNLMPELPQNTPSVFDTYKNADGHMTEVINRYL